ncbi:MAG: methylated-DNA--[protein]-cysteine S-methyltransferase [Gammaproteobacteria bacterium]|nr:methylated-DNA--[protein]-cysteine S-methyltransferase [Gammaproteobacteria bacterium]
MVTGTLKYDAVIATPFGRIGITAQDNALCGIDLLSPRISLRSSENSLALDVCRQIQAYIDDPASSFDLPLCVSGTVYQQRVWTTLQQIVPGEAVSYGALAHKLSSGPRAVAAACRANAVPIVIPCHRVVAKTGLGGYMGQRDGPAMRMKTWLLEHESPG